MEQLRQPNNDLHRSGRRLPSGLLVRHDAEREQSMTDDNLHKRSLRLLLTLHCAEQCAQCCRHPIPAPAPRIAQAQASTRKRGFRGYNALPNRTRRVTLMVPCETRSPRSGLMQLLDSGWSCPPLSSLSSPHDIFLYPAHLTLAPAALLMHPLCVLSLSEHLLLHHSPIPRQR